MGLFSFLSGKKKDSLPESLSVPIQLQMIPNTGHQSITNY